MVFVYVVVQDVELRPIAGPLYPEVPGLAACCDGVRTWGYSHPDLQARDVGKHLCQDYLGRRALGSYYLLTGRRTRAERRGVPTRGHRALDSLGRSSQRA